MHARRRRLRTSLLLGVGAALTCVMLLVTLTDSLRQLELDTVDARFQIRGDQEPLRSVVGVHVDDKTFQDLNTQWPFPRDMHATVIDRLRRAGARVIAYDVQFTEESGNSAAAIRRDNALITAVHRARPRVVLGASEVNEFGETAVFGGDEVVREVGARVGNVNFPADPDGVIRRVPLRVDRLTSFAVAAVEAADPGLVPRDRMRDGSAWIDYGGDPDATISVSFSDVYRGLVDPERFRDAFVVVGASAPTLQDLHSTSVSGDKVMSGAEIQASAISTLVRGAPLRGGPAWLDTVLVIVFGMFASIASLLIRRPYGPLVTAGVGIGYVVLVQLTFNAGIILPLVDPIVAITVSTIGVLLVEYGTSAFEREHVRTLFARFVPESIVDEVIGSTDQDLRLAGKQLTSTVVFCDVRDFTTFTEQRSAGEVIKVLNQYLTRMSEAIRDQGGTLLSYRGDGILCIFGAPIEQPDHADRALAAVRDMAGPRLAGLNAWLREQEIDYEVTIGIGVNSGFIMSGNVGCEWRVEYTAIGDDVNVAARLEEMTKQVPHQVLISDTTRAMLQRETLDLIYVDATSVRGKQVKANLWTLASEAPSLPDRAPGPGRRAADPLGA